MKTLIPLTAAVGLSVSLSNSAIADSDLYFTNNTAQALSVSIQHSGNDLLEKGSEWLQHSQHVGPYETKMLLSVNRWTGIKSGKTYNFTTTLTNEFGDSVALHQTMEGTWSGSNIQHGFSASDIPLTYYDDRNIHRGYSNYNSQSSEPTEVAFKASATKRYDDFYYTLTPKNIPEQANSNPDQLKIMTYNIWALPVIASHIGDRFKALPDYVKGYDALMLQEVFASGRNDFLRELAKEYPYQTKMLNKSGINIYDGGVTIVSRYPIVNEAQYVYPDCSGTDCFADKGVNYAEIIKNGRAYHLFATHTASFDTDTARDYRQRQFKQIRQLANTLSIPKNETVVYGGDFNVNKLKFPSDYQDMFANLSAIEPTYAGYTASTFDPRINKFAGEPGSGGENVEYLDYIVISDEYKSVNNNINTVKVPRTASEALWKHWDLSDHFPVKAEIQ